MTKIYKEYCKKQCEITKSYKQLKNFYVFNVVNYYYYIF